MKTFCREFTRMQVLLLIGLTTGSIGCEAFVGTHHSRKSGPMPLFVSSPKSEYSDLLEGKLVVLQDVVKELDARNKKLQDESKTAQHEYDEKLHNLQKDLQESEQTKEKQESAIHALEEAIEKHALDLENLQHTKDRERESETKLLKSENEDELEKLRSKFGKEIQELEEKLESTTTEANNLSKQLKTAETKAEDTEKDALIEELTQQIAVQQKELDANRAIDSKAKVEASTSEESSNTEELKIQHQKEIDDYENKIDALRASKEKSILDLEAQYEKRIDELETKCDELVVKNDEAISKLKSQHLKDVEDYESRLDSIFADKEEVASNLRAEHQSELEEYERKLKSAQADTEQLSSEVKAIEAKCEEQVAIASASVEASEAREENLRDEAKAFSKQAKMYWIAAKLANILYQRTDKELSAVLEEREQLLQENGELYLELETTKQGVQDLIQQLENQTNLWQKLRSKVSRKR